MVEFNPKEGDIELEKMYKYPELVKKVDGIRSFVFKNVNTNTVDEFTEFDSVYHLIDTMETLNKEGLRDILKDTPQCDGDYHYEEKNEWTYGTTYPDRVSTMEALMDSKVEDTMWLAIDKLRDSLLKDSDIQRLMELAPSIKKQRKFGSSGDELDIDRVLAGDPEHWQYTTPGRKSNVIRIGVNVAVSCGNKADTFLKMVALASVAADLVVKAGASLEFVLVAFSTSSYESDNDYMKDGKKIGTVRRNISGFLATIKKAEEPFDISRVACLGIPGLFRHYLFCAKTAFGSNTVSYGLGTASKIKPDIYERFGLKHIIEVTHTDQGEQKLFLKNIFSTLAGQEVPEEVY